MTKRIKIIAILLSVILIVGVIGSIGATAAIWGNQSGEAGNDTLGTAIDSNDWNVWAKYCEFELINDSGAMITAFNTQEAGFNSNRLTIPSQLIYAEGAPFVVSISGHAFQNSALKEMVEEIYIPYTVTKICSNAFSGFINLRKIVFGAIGEDSSDNEKKVVIDMFAFSGCASLDKDTGIIYEGIEGETQRVPEIDANAFYASGTLIQETP